MNSVNRDTKPKAEKKEIIGVDMGSPDGDYTVKGYRDDTGQFHITEVIGDTKPNGWEQKKTEKIYKLSEKLDLTTLSEISELLYEQASPFGEINTPAGKWVFVNPTNKQWFSKEELHQAILSAEERAIKKTIRVICKRLDDLGDLCDHIPVWKSAIKDCVLSEGTKKLLSLSDQEQLSNNKTE